ncbi:MAG TPA: hypothetical protein VF173_36695 [Thermoanaerobaculia bacterium]|nr:hypothetical protein [Thermoanaerobaculia bacterium]
MKAPTSDPSLSELQHLQHLWDREKHENDLINHRLSWLWTLQGLLFTAFGVLAAKDVKTFGMPISVICGVGMASCFSVWWSLRKGHQMLRNIVPVANALVERIKLPYGLAGPTRPSDSHSFLLPWRCLPLVMLLAWLVLLGWVLRSVFA